MKKLLSSQRGFTLTELLMSVAIMGILFSTIVMGVNSAVHVYRRSVTLSDSQTLSSTLSNALEKELRCAGNISTDGSTVKFDSETFGSGVTVGSSSGRILVGSYKLLSDDVYTSGLTAVVNSFSFNPDNSLFTVSFTISGPLIQDRELSLSIKALNR